MSELQCPMGKPFCTSEMMKDTPCAWRVDGKCVVIVIAEHLAEMVKKK